MDLLEHAGKVVRRQTLVGEVWDTQTGARGQSQLSLLVFRVALAVKVVYPASVVERVEKTFKRGDRLPDAH